MEETKIIEGVNEGVVVEVCEEVGTSNSFITVVKGLGVVAGLGALGYGIYRGFKYLKNRKNQNEIVESELNENE